MSSSIDSINQTTKANGTAISNKDALMGKQDFLMLLVAQLQNQDPLNPSDPTEFTAQLAQFSSLEQLFSLNESMENLVTSNANADRFTTLNTIGKDAAYHSSSFNFTGEPVEIGYQLDGDASEVTLSLQHNGVTMATINGEELSSGSHYFTWDGILPNDQAAPAGKYEITIQAKSGSEESVGVAPLVKSEVTGVDLNGEYGGVLITKAGEVAFSSILGVYEPGSSKTPTTETDE
ncbi:MAG: flagellar hook assembly protein FlgD [Desulforhopalus sp.]